VLESGRREGRCQTICLKSASWVEINDGHNVLMVAAETLARVTASPTNNFPDDNPSNTPKLYPLFLFLPSSPLPASIHQIQHPTLPIAQHVHASKTVKGRKNQGREQVRTTPGVQTALNTTH
jgi:hypothetical protein